MALRAGIFEALRAGIFEALRARIFEALCAGIFEALCAGQESNPQPNRYERSALTVELPAHGATAP